MKIKQEDKQATLKLLVEQHDEKIKAKEVGVLIEYDKAGAFHQATIRIPRGFATAVDLQPGNRFKLSLITPVKDLKTTRPKLIGELIQDEKEEAKV